MKKRLPPSPIDPISLSLSLKKKKKKKKKKKEKEKKDNGWAVAISGWPTTAVFALACLQPLRTVVQWNLACCISLRDKPWAILGPGGAVSRSELPSGNGRLVAHFLAFRTLSRQSLVFHRCLKDAPKIIRDGQGCHICVCMLLLLFKKEEKRKERKEKKKKFAPPPKKNKKPQLIFL